MLPSVRSSLGRCRVVNNAAVIFSRACSNSTKITAGGYHFYDGEAQHRHSYDTCDHNKVFGGSVITPARRPTWHHHHHPLSSGFPLVIRRSISVYGPSLSEVDKKEGEGVDKEEEIASAEDEEEEQVTKGKAETKKKAPVARHLDRDRSKKIPVETSMRYLKSEAYRESYGDNPVWVMYRRNFPGQWQPKKTRKTCIRNDEITTGNPCPLCRDIYLVVDYRNVDLLKQFISPYTGEVLHWDKTGVCRRKQERLLIEIDRAKDWGTITFDVPVREYDYKEYEHLYATYK